MPTSLILVVLPCAVFAYSKVLLQPIDDYDGCSRSIVGVARLTGMRNGSKTALG